MPFFRPYQHMVRPMPVGSTTMDGTLTDGLVDLCASASGEPWGLIIFVKTGEQRNAVLLPYPERTESQAIYLEFLKNDHEQIHVMHGIYESEPAQ